MRGLLAFGDVLRLFLSGAALVRGDLLRIGLFAVRFVLLLAGKRLIFLGSLFLRDFLVDRIGLAVQLLDVSAFLLARLKASCALMSCVAASCSSLKTYCRFAMNLAMRRIMGCGGITRNYGVSAPGCKFALGIKWISTSSVDEPRTSTTCGVVKAPLSTCRRRLNPLSLVMTRDGAITLRLV